MEVKVNGKPLEELFKPNRMAKELSMEDEVMFFIAQDLAANKVPMSQEILCAYLLGFRAGDSFVRSGF